MEFVEKIQFLTSKLRICILKIQYSQKWKKLSTNPPQPPRERIKCLIFDDEMCTLQKVGGEDSKGRRVLRMPKTSLKHVI